MAEHRQIGRLNAREAAGRFAEGERIQSQQQRPKSNQQSKHQGNGEQRIAREAGTHDQKFAHENPERRHAGNRHDAEHQRPSQYRMRYRQPPDLRDALRAFHLRYVTHGEEYRRFGKAVHAHLQQSGEIRQWSADAEGEHDDAHMFDRGIGEHAFDVAAPVQHEGGENQRQQAHCDHQWPRRQRIFIGRQQHFETEHGIERHVEEQTG